ncbi:Trk system potassium uptake protein TrkG [Enhygromyxa salina]|uniref:Trk system potassium uptake protein TrkG n=1 Tax=Enhygromyxa salina TaxID=215803 RepID=A0A2S9XB18_9BACT|nr:TrkH family potassium uptake protein [Enhygromyxa salina]PRP90048.1 Trk system potassium uptake protein TrkG [Enhygromyxa salina]
MTPRVVAKLAAPLLAIVAATMLAPLGLAIFDGRSRSAIAYLASGLACVLVALLLARLGRDQDQEVNHKDAIGVVVLIWLVMGIFGGLPFMLEGALLDPAAALFEAVSGFTTTGATVVGDIEGLSRASNLWRCEMHWIGGMGIVVLFVAVFPQLGVGAKQLFRNEVPGPTTEGLRPHIKQTAVALWWIYGGLTVLCAILMVVAGMPIFDAICHSMSTLGTGGYSPKAASIGAYQNPAIDWITAAFMLVAGLNFGLYYAAARGRWRALFTNPETRFYLGLNVVVTVVVAWSIWSRHPSIGESLRYASFQTLAVTTTTGFMTEDFDTYPNVARYLLFLCMFVGGCAGSTAGGIKVVRVYLMFKVMTRELRSLAAPHAVATVKLGKQSMPPGVISAVLVFFVTYLLIFVATSLLLVALDLELMTAMSATVACLSSVGPGLDAVGPAQNFAVVPALGKLALCGCMVAGRLELFVLLSVFSRELWRR